MKKLLALCLALVLCLGACAALAADVKIGVILVGDETETYTLAHMEGIKAALAANGIPDSSIIWKYKIAENDDAYTNAVDLVGQGCNLIISNSYGHQTYMALAAEEYPDVTFVAMTGDQAAVSGIANLKNAFTRVFESRYVSGMVAGMKLAELLSSGELSAQKQPNSFTADGNVKIGYVGAFPYAEVVSGYTAFFLGLRSVVSNVTMEVQYTNSWGDLDKESAAADALIANGCVIIGQHADSTGAPAAVQKHLDEGTVCYSVGYNVSMLPTAPTAALTSATSDWSVYYSELFAKALAGEEIPFDWAKGYADNAVLITELGPKVAAGTAEKVEETIAAIKDGSLKVFNTSTFTVGGQAVTTHTFDSTIIDFATMQPIYEGAKYEAIVDGAFEESSFRSAPYFDLRIDGIVEDAQ